MWAEPAIEILYRKVEELIRSELSLVKNARSELEKLSSYLTAIQAVLADADSTKKITNKAVQDWLEKLKDAAHDADDILDDWEILEARLRRRPVNNNNNNKLLASLSSLKKKAKRAWPLRRIAKKIIKVTKRFEQIAKEKSDLGLTERATEAVSDRIKGRETSLFPIENQIYGRDGDVQNIVNLLLENRNYDDVSVIPILGMCGVGKTILAQFVCKNETVVQHFGVRRRYWCWLPDDFDAKLLLRRFLEDITRTPCTLDSLNAIQRELQQQLNGERFLLVLDDVWNESQELWNTLKSCLSYFAKGSSIIITTRLHAVADSAGTHPAYELPLLSDNDCWLLFQSYAFKNTRNLVHSRLGGIGLEIVEKCGGLPLAARVLGDLLRKETQRQWEVTRDGEILGLQGEVTREREREILNLRENLRLSYRCLVSQAKHCFSHCSLFPKGPEIEKKELIHTWMANKLALADGNIEYEDQGEEILTELLRHSMLIGTRRDDDGKTIKCKIHDLLHNLASSILKNHCSLVAADGKTSKNIPKKVRHLSVTGINNRNPDFSVSSFKSLRTLHLTSVNLPMLPAGTLKYLRCLTLKSCGLQMLPNNVFGKLRNLQMLSLANLDLQVLPTSVGDLENLRYLDLSRNPRITSLPESIGGLERLEMLKVVSCSGLESLPVQLCNLASLKSLRISSCPYLRSLPVMEMQGRNSNLRSLHIVECAILESRFEQLQHLTTLESFELRNCPNSLFSPPDLEHLTALKYLKVDPGVALPESVRARLS